MRMAVSYARWTRIVRSIMSVVDIVFLTYNNMNIKHLCTYQNPITNKEGRPFMARWLSSPYDARDARTRGASVARGASFASVDERGARRKRL